MKLTAGLGLAALLVLGGACASEGGGNASGAGGTQSSGGSSGRGGSSGGNQGSGGSGTSAGGSGGSGTSAGGSGGSGTGGSGTGGSGTGGSGTGGSGTGGTGTGGSGGSGTGGTGGTPSACNTRTSSPYSGPLLGRCNPMSCTDGKCGQAVARGGFFTLDDFEGLPSATAPIGINWPARDSRTGSWIQLAAPTTNGTLEVAATDTNGGAPGSKQALHYRGGTGVYGAAAGLPMGTNCYDASAYEGISFWIKGNPGAGNTRIKFSVHTPVSEPVESGGACTMECYDHFAKMVDITPSWTRVKLKWADLTQTWCAKSVPPVPANWQAEKQILALSFSQTDPMKPFDFWIDDITFDLDTRPANNFAEIVSKPTFDEMFKTPKAPFSYEGLVAAIAKYGTKWGGSFGADGMPIDRKHEAAAFLAQIAHETGSLTLAEEMCKCTMPPYYGRGAIQLTGMANYQAAESAGFSGIVANPARVLQDADYAFGTALWFWMTPRSAVGVCHQAAVQGDFGQITRIINGIECGSNPTSLQHSRVKLYKEFAAALGINVRGNLLCQ